MFQAFLFMKVDRTKYTVHRENGIIVAQWVSIEVSIDESNGESPLAALDRSMELEQQWYKSKNIGLSDNSIPPGPPPVINIERTSEDRRIAELIRDIYACKGLDGDNGLWTYSKLASTSAEVQSVYCIMEKKLRDKEISSIMEATNAGIKNKNILDGYNKNTKIKKDK
jgi:hypothetical protein